MGEAPSIRLKNSRRDRIDYLVDRILARRWRCFAAIVAWGILQMVLGGVAYASVWHTDEGDLSFEAPVSLLVECVWESWTFMADPGTHAKARQPGERLVGAAIALCGIILFSALLGITVDLIKERMDALRRGKARILAKDHALILGWTEKTMHIIEELCKANESEGGGLVAVLAPVDKEVMEFELEMQLPARQRRGTRVVFRCGSPVLMPDLIHVNVHMAKAIIILASSGNANEADENTLRTLLSLQSLYGCMKGHILAEVRDIDNEPLMKVAGGAKVETLVSHDMIGRLMLMSVQQPGLAKVYESLLGFDGNEFYMEEWPALEGEQFGNLQERFPDAVPIGIASTHSCAGHTASVIKLRPPASWVVRPGDKVIVIAEDNDSYRPAPPMSVNAGVPPALDHIAGSPEKILLCGWRRDIRDVLLHLDKVVCRGSEVHMMTHCVPLNQRDKRLLDEGFDVSELVNIRIVHHYGNTSVRRKLEELPVEAYSSCMIFADEAFESDSLHADSHSLATLLLFRDIQSQRLQAGSRGPSKDRPGSRVPSKDREAAMGPRSWADMKTGTVVVGMMNEVVLCPIICEVLDPHTQKTIVNNRPLSLASDFCQTNRLIAQILAMIAEERTVNKLFDELLGDAGCNIAVVPSGRYAHRGETLSFYELAKRASSFDELLVGYQIQRSTSKTVLNPPDKDVPHPWDKYDLAILRNDRRHRDAHADAPGAPPEPCREGAPDSQAGQQAAKAAERSISKPNSQHTPFSSADGEEVVAGSGTDGVLGGLVSFVASCHQMGEDDRRRLGQAIEALRQAVVAGSAELGPSCGKPVEAL